MSEGAKRPDPARIEELFDALIDLPTDEAARRLALDCEGDEALRAAVLRLLAHDRAVADTFLAPSDTLLVAAAQALHEPEVSARLGRFFVLRKLGEGGMGAVYLGYDESLDRRVALKLLHRRAGSPVFLQREGQALGRLAHPNVVAVHAQRVARRGRAPLRRAARGLRPGGERPAERARRGPGPP
jgi:serine/threonine-protein kinase